MAIEIKELVVRAWVDSQSTKKSDTKRLEKTGNETTAMSGEMLEQLKRSLTDLKDR